MMCINPENESPNVVNLASRRTASEWMGQTSGTLVRVNPEPDTFDSADHAEWEAKEHAKLGNGVTRVQVLRALAWFVGWCAVVIVASSLAGYAVVHGVGGLIEALAGFSQLVP